MQYLLGFPTTFIILLRISSNSLYITSRCWHQKTTEVRLKVALPPCPDSSPSWLCPKPRSSVPAGTWHGELPGAHSDPHVLPQDCLGHSPPLQIPSSTCLSRFITNSPLVPMTTILSQWLHSPNKSHYSDLPPSTATVHQTRFTYTSASGESRVLLHRCVSVSVRGNCFSLPLIRSEGHRDYSENTVFGYRVAETCVKRSSLK